MRKKMFMGFMVLLGVLLCGFCWSRFCSVGRYQIAFGDVQERYMQVLLPEETGEKYTKDEEQTMTVPVCFKIDTLTGRTWKYRFSFWVDAQKDTHKTDEFEKMESDSDW